MATEVATLDEARELLYGHPLAEFVAERDALVKAIRATKNRDLANEVKALRKPSAVAAEVNQVVRADPSGVELILQAAELLRAAQTGALEGSDIDATLLQQQYRAAIQALAQTAASRPVEVRSALEAATIDVASNDALRTGCLVAVPTPTSIFDGPASTSAPAPASAPSDPTPKPKQVDELEARRAKKQAVAEKTAEKRAASRVKREEAERKKQAAEHKQQAAEVKRKEAEAKQKEVDRKRVEAEQKKKAAAEKKRLAAEQKRLDAERRERKKELKKAHRQAVRAHLAALDAEEASQVAFEEAELRIVEIDDEIEELQERRVDAEAERDAADLAKGEASALAAEEQAAVDALADELEALE